jgi:ABC transport system ATP-binding/permease protein
MSKILSLTWPDGSQTSIFPQQSFLTLGRSPENDIVVPARYLSVSRNQAVLKLNSRENWVIEPKSKSVSIKLAGKPIVGVSELEHETQIQIGELVLSVALLDQHNDNRPAETFIGRSPGPKGISLEHPMVSRRHACLKAGASGLQIRDLSSANGTYVDGKRIRTSFVTLLDGQRIDIGPFAFVVAGVSLKPRTVIADERLAAKGVGLVVKDRASGAPLTILEPLTLSIGKGAFVCLIGESGSGKSTLMKHLAGRVTPTSGTVEIDGLDMFQHFDAIKQDLSYVPQDDILHNDLTLQDALMFAGKLRLPPDLSNQALGERILEVAREVDLEVRLGTKISALSGGQKKRASLACELLSKPSVLYLDEVTSGLDEATDREMMAVLRRLADDGVTIICVTHTLAHIEMFADRLIVMGRGGVCAYDGNAKVAAQHFGVEKLGQVFDVLARDGASVWHEQRNENVSLGTLPPPSDIGPPTRQFRPFEPLRQYAILCDRNLKLLLADRRGIMMAAAQSLIIGGLVGYAFSDYGAKAQEVPSQLSLLMLLGMASLWLGCNASAQDIVGSLTIFRRERDVNLSAGAYVFSRWTITGLFTLIQMGVVYGLASMFAQDMPGDTMTQCAILALGSLVGVAMGLFISSLCETRDQATTIVPLALIPQLILAGVLVPALPQSGKDLSEIAVSAFWLTEGLKADWIETSSPISILDGVTGTLKDLTSKPLDDMWTKLTGHLAILLAGAWGATRFRG